MLHDACDTTDQQSFACQGAQTQEINRAIIKASVIRVVHGSRALDNPDSDLRDILMLYDLRSAERDDSSRSRSSTLSRRLEEMHDFIDENGDGSLVLSSLSFTHRPESQPWPRTCPATTSRPDSC